MSNLVKDILKFQAYCLSFYNDQDGVYPIATKERVIQAVDQYLRETPLGQIYFDSFDREKVRTIIEPTN